MVLVLIQCFTVSDMVMITVEEDMTGVAPEAGVGIVMRGLLVAT